MTWPTNNPNGIEAGNFASSHGSIGSYPGAKNQTIAIFPNYAAGQNAAIDLWSSYLNQYSTVGAAIQGWTGKNLSDIRSYTQAIMNGLPVGTTTGTSTENVSASQMQAAQQAAEGWKPGSVTCGGPGG